MINQCYTVKRGVYKTSHFCLFRWDISLSPVRRVGKNQSAPCLRMCEIRAAGNITSGVVTTTFQMNAYFTQRSFSTKILHEWETTRQINVWVMTVVVTWCLSWFSSHPWHKKDIQSDSKAGMKRCWSLIQVASQPTKFLWKQWPLWLAGI